MSPTEEIRHAIRSFRFAVIVFAVVVLAMASIFVAIMTIQVPYMLRVTLEEFYAEKEFVIVE